jgi:hypothetical protein
MLPSPDDVNLAANQAVANAEEETLTVLSKLFAARTITTTANEYHYSEKMAKNLAGWLHSSERPAFVERLYARENLFGKWSVYSAIERPGCIATINGMVIDSRQGEIKRIAKNLSLSEAFMFAREHEFAPPQKEHSIVSELLSDYYKIPSEEKFLFLVQKKPPADDATYWRNLTPRPSLP